MVVLRMVALRGRLIEGWRRWVRLESTMIRPFFFFGDKDGVQMQLLRWLLHRWGKDNRCES